MQNSGDFVQSVLDVESENCTIVKVTNETTAAKETKMVQTYYILNTKKQVEKRLLEVQQKYNSLSKGDRPFAVDLDMQISHLQSALRNWIDGKSEFTRII